MDIHALRAHSRRETGKSSGRRLRREGKLPGVLYGTGMDPVPLFLEVGDLAKIMQKTRGEYALFDLTVEDEPGKGETHRSLLRELQVHPVGGHYLHADFQQIRMDRKIDLEVPVVLEGDPVGVKLEGGILEHQMRQAAITCLPDKIPDVIRVDVSGLGLNDSVHLAQVIPDYPEVEFEDEPTKAIATIVLPAKVAAPTAEEEAVEAVEGEGEGEAGKPGEEEGKPEKEEGGEEG
jgi:large subunit ribosomal protein L25